MTERRSGIGDRSKRREDWWFLTGHGAYLDDLNFDGLTHAVVLRSPHAHARIGAIDASVAPFYDPGFNNTRCTTNPLGVKGCGEAGAVAGFPAIANAILDALAPFGAADLSGPATPERIWRRIPGHSR